jgi:MoxR-like ATPase
VAGVELNRSASFADLFGSICGSVATVIRGKNDVIALAVTTMLAEGHLLVEDVPGVGKTSLDKALATTIGATFGRLQFTPDLLPTDVVGTSIWNQRDARFEYRPGPIFANVLLADEINRASPKTQSALLEAMADGQVTTDGTTRALPNPFMVIATQNPLEHHGTYPLPESQLDRFLMKVTVGYPDRGHELELLSTDGGDAALDALVPAVSPTTVAGMSQAAAQVHVDSALAGYLLDLAAASRSHPHLVLGVSPRAVLGLQRAMRVWAAAHGRDFATADDARALAVAVLAHRVAIAPGATVQGIDAAGVIREILAATPVPTEPAALASQR